MVLYALVETVFSDAACYDAQNFVDYGWVWSRCRVFLTGT